MGSANGGRRKQPPFRSEPERGKIADAGVESSGSNEAWDVLKVDEAGSNLANNAGNVGPYPSVVVEALAGSGGAVWLARESRSDDVHHSTKLSSREVGKVRPNRRWIKAPRFHERDQLVAGRCFPLAVSNRAQSEAQVFKSEGDTTVQHSHAGT